MSQITHIGLSLLGYSRHQVERLIEDKDRAIQELMKEVERLKQQAQTMEQSLEKYTTMEQALKDGIVDARLAGKKIVQESTEEAERLIHHTNEQVAQYKEEFAEYSHDLVANGTQVKDKMNEMKAELLATLAKYQALVDETDFNALFPSKEVTRFNHQLEEFIADDSLHLLSATDSKNWVDGAMSEEEKQALQQLIHEVTEEESQVQPKAVGMENETVFEESEPVELELEEAEATPEAKLVQFKPKNKR